jgi:hypothetical protein
MQQHIVQRMGGVSYAEADRQSVHLCIQEYIRMHGPLNVRVSKRMSNTCLKLYEFA